MLPPVGPDAGAVILGATDPVTPNEPEEVVMFLPFLFCSLIPPFSPYFLRCWRSTR